MKPNGVAGLEDRRLGRASARAVPVNEVLELVTLYESRYTGWTALAPGTWRDAFLYVDQKPAVSGWSRRPSQEAAPQTLARHDAPSRWLDP